MADEERHHEAKQTGAAQAPSYSEEVDALIVQMVVDGKENLSHHGLEEFEFNIQEGNPNSKPHVRSSYYDLHSFHL